MLVPTPLLVSVRNSNWCGHKQHQHHHSGGSISSSTDRCSATPTRSKSGDTSAHTTPVYAASPFAPGPGLNEICPMCSHSTLRRRTTSTWTASTSTTSSGLHIARSDTPRRFAASRRVPREISSTASRSLLHTCAATGESMHVAWPHLQSCTRERHASDTSGSFGSFARRYEHYCASAGHRGRRYGLAVTAEMCYPSVPAVGAALREMLRRNGLRRLLISTNSRDAAELDAIRVEVQREHRRDKWPVSMRTERRRRRSRGCIHRGSFRAQVDFVRWDPPRWVAVSRPEWVPHAELLLCAHAAAFVGTLTSTYSASVCPGRTVRDHH